MVLERDLHEDIFSHWNSNWQIRKCYLSCSKKETEYFALAIRKFDYVFLTMIPKKRENKDDFITFSSKPIVASWHRQTHTHIS